MEIKEKIEKLKEIREEYTSICGYEKDFVHGINYKIDMLLEEDRLNQR